MKKIFAGIIFVLVMTINSVFAANWVSVKAANGKSAMLDTENLEITNGHYVKYWVKSTINNYTYRYFMLSDYTANSSCILETYKYDKNGKLLENSENNVNLEQIIPDTLNEALYNKVSELVKKNPLYLDTSVWNSYFKSVQKQVGKFWKPKSDSTSSNSIATLVSFKVNKDGEILRKEITQKSYNESYDKSVEKALEKVSKFPTLPQGYDGDIDFVFEFKYTFKGEMPASSATIGSNGIGSISLSKEKAHAGKVILNCVGTVLILPFAILGVLLGAA